MASENDDIDNFFIEMSFRRQLEHSTVGSSENDDIDLMRAINMEKKIKLVENKNISPKNISLVENDF